MENYCKYLLTNSLKTGPLKRSSKKSLLVIPNITMATVASKKAVIREQIPIKLTAVAEHEKKSQSKIVYEKLISLPAFQNSKRISTFLSIDNEIDTEPIVRKIFADGKECFVPRYNKKGMQMVKLNGIDDWATLPVTSWGIKQPSFKDQRDDALDTGGLDFVVVPGVAFTADGKRLGHGGGYYDRFLQGLRAAQRENPPALVALAFNEQILDDIPTTETDVRIDLILHA